MQARKLLLFAAGAGSLVFAACGGAVSDPFGDGGTEAGDAACVGCQDGGACTGTPPSCFCGSPVCRAGQWTCSSCHDDCATQAANLDVLRGQLRACCPTCKSVQCANVAEDVCCPITVNQGDIAGFEALAKKYKAQCSPICPGAPCPPAPSNLCDPMGVCR